MKLVKLEVGVKEFTSRVGVMLQLYCPMLLGRDCHLFPWLVKCAQGEVPLAAQATAMKPMKWPKIS